MVWSTVPLSLSWQNIWPACNEVNQISCLSIFTKPTSIAIYVYSGRGGKVRLMVFLLSSSYSSSALCFSYFLFSFCVYSRRASTFSCSRTLWACSSCPSLSFLGRGKGCLSEPSCSELQSLLFLQNRRRGEPYLSPCRFPPLLWHRGNFVDHTPSGTETESNNGHQ